MTQSYIRNLVWHCVIICLISLAAVGALMEYAGFSLKVSFYIGWALGITFLSATGTIPFVTFYRAITGRGFAEYFWLLWTTWMVLVFFLLPATYLGQRMIETGDPSFTAAAVHKEPKGTPPAAQTGEDRFDDAPGDEIETDWPEQEPYAEINFDGFRARGGKGNYFSEV